MSSPAGATPTGASSASASSAQSEEQRAKEKARRLVAEWHKKRSSMRQMREKLRTGPNKVGKQLLGSLHSMQRSHACDALMWHHISDNIEFFKNPGK